MENPSLRRNNVLFAAHRINICITTTVKNDLNCSVRSARLFLKSTTVLKERLKPNTFVRTANTPCSAGKSFCMLLFTNAPTITALTALTHSTNLTQRKSSYKKQNLLNSNSTTFTANIYSKPRNLFTPAPSNHSSTLEGFITLKISSALSCPSTSPSPSPPVRLLTSCKTFLISASLTRPSSITPNLPPTTATDSTSNSKAPLMILPPEMKPISKLSETGPTFFYLYHQRTLYSPPITSRIPAKRCLPSSL